MDDWRAVDQRDRPHLVVSGYSEAETFTSPQRARLGKIPDRTRLDHAKKLRQEALDALSGARATLLQADPAAPRGEEGVYLDFAIQKGSEPIVDALESQKKQIELISVKPHPTRESDFVATVFVPSKSALFFNKKIRAFQKQDTPKGNPRYAELVSRISSIAAGDIRSVWDEDTGPLPQLGADVWWEVWTRTGLTSRFITIARHIGLRVDDQAVLRFPERSVLLCHGTRELVEQAMQSSGAVAELRNPISAPSFLLSLGPAGAAEVVQQLLGRITNPSQADPAVCLLDSGVNFGHPLLVSSLAAADAQSYNPAWGSGDTQYWQGHGTAMAGIALLGDLAELVGTQHQIVLQHRLESVKILPPAGQNDPEAYGYITIESGARAEIQNPNRLRVFCMAVTSDKPRSDGKPSSWSSAIDRFISDEAHRRLFVISAGNIDGEIMRQDYPPRNDATPVKNPAQAWNAISVGAYTQKTEIYDPQFVGRDVLARPGDLAPVSATSVSWSHRWPIKPEIVCEGGNLCIEPVHDVGEAIDDLCLISTNHAYNVTLLKRFRDTSAAAAQASKLCAELLSEFPTFWPETIRGLVVHSARWSSEMISQFNSDPPKSKALSLRRYGYGVPDRDRAFRSALNDLTLIAEETITPFQKIKSDIKTKEMNIHQLPWPTQVLEGLGNEEVELRITLSYYISPNPGERSWSRTHSYSSFGLRFDVKRAGENLDQFRKRVNKAAREEGEIGGAAASDPGWYLGAQLRNRGSIHSDYWYGKASDLAKREAIGVFPISGWWKENRSLGGWENETRYSLIATIRTKTADVYTPVATLIQAEAEIEVAAPIDVPIDLEGGE